MCGEKGRRTCRPLFASGSPPRVRGKVCLPARRRARYRITPACAGKSAAGSCFARWARDHPRVCGEKTRWLLLAVTSPGSPPRVRGKARYLMCCSCCWRITPACAGKRRAARSSRRTGWDHPRVCGEMSSSIAPRSPSLGSPPRVRGKVLLACLLPLLHGITPACAGKSDFNCLHQFIHEDHPRVCGEKFLKIIGRAHQLGSPPRVRGKVFESEMNSSAVRITPACAGKRDYTG